MEVGPLRHADLWHTGFVVDDLAAAKVDLSERLGVTWYEGGAEVRLLDESGPRSVTTAYLLSKEGPHHVEITQSVPGTLWTATAQTHHLGYWVDDVAAASDALIARGAARLASVGMRDDAPPMCAYHRSPAGPVVEIVHRKMRRALLPGS